MMVKRRVVTVAATNFNAVLIRLVDQVKITLLVKIQWRKTQFISDRIVYSRVRKWVTRR